MGPHPAVAAIRLAVRRVLHDVLTEFHRHEAPGGPGRPGAEARRTAPAAASRYAEAGTAGRSGRAVR
ncbi:tRNA lysidine(34) synthetase TilS, partial [Streptomyces sp. MBT57]|nr:tRNA lysidine(34) synthetase TilS [Streptomyces sp. MBT57]